MAEISTLSEAIQSGDLAAVKKILSEHPALADAKTEENISFVMRAMYYRKPEIAEFIAGKKSSLMVEEAIVLGREEIVKNFFDNEPGAVNEYTPDGFTYLALAVYFGKNFIAEYLIEKGADVNAQARNQAKVAPIHAAVSTRNFEMAKILLECGADVNAKQNSGVTPLHGAAHNGDLPMVELLLSYGADCNAKMDDRRTPLDMAVEKNFAEIVEKLCRHEESSA